MEIAFRVRGVEVPDSLRRRTRDKVTKLARLCGIEQAEVAFSEERNPRIAEREVCQITLFGPAGILRGHAAATDLTVAAERVVVQLEQRVDRFRGRQVRRRYSRWCSGPVSAAATNDGWVNFPTNRSAAGREPGAVDLVVASAGEKVGLGPRDAHARPMTPEEAALEMADRDGDVFFFVNVETGRPAVVYHRRDGAIALYDAGAVPGAMRW